MSNELAKMQSSTMDLIPDASEWGTIHNMAKALLPTGFLPEGIKTPEQAVAIILKGRELRIPPMYALSNIHVIKGKPTVSAEVMLALIQRDLGMDFMWVEESTNDYCKVGYRSGGGKKFYTFSINDAKLAGLTKNPTWNSYPAAMLRARAISATARMIAPGVIAGMYVPGELGDPVEINEDGSVVSGGPYAGQPQMTGTVEQIEAQAEVIDDDGVIEDDANQDGPLEEHDDPEWLSAANYLSKLVSKYKITNAEGKAMLHKWGVPSARIEDMSTEQLRKACDFINKKGDQIKPYVEQALADEQELDAINQMPIEV